MTNQCGTRVVSVGCLILAATVAAVAASTREGQRGSPGLTPVYGQATGACVWVGTTLMGPCDLQSEESSALADGRVDSYSYGMEIWGYGWLYTSMGDCVGINKVLTKSTSSYGRISVTRTVACGQPQPVMTGDWFPRFKAQATVHEPDASCHSAGRMKGDCNNLDVHVLVEGGAAATGESNGSYSIVIAGNTVGLNSTSGDSNSFAGQDGDSDTKLITSDVAVFICNEDTKVRIPGWSFTDWERECETWLWDSFPELDLHGACTNCGAFKFATYGWTQ